MPYHTTAIALARSRGYIHLDHVAALITVPLDVDAVSLTHICNWLTEEEVERTPWDDPEAEWPTTCTRRLVAADMPMCTRAPGHSGRCVFPPPYDHEPYSPNPTIVMDCSDPTEVLA